MYRKGAQGWVKHLDFMIWDILCLEASFWLAYVLRHHSVNPYANPIYLNMAVVLFLIDSIVIVFFEPLKNVLKRGMWREFNVTLRHICLVTLMSSFYLVLTQEGEAYSRWVLIWTAGINLIVSYAVRLIWKYYLRTRKNLRGQRSLLIITSDTLADQVAENIYHYNYEAFHIAGFVITDKDHEGDQVRGIPVVANKDNVIEWICRSWVDETLIHIAPNEPYPQELIDKLGQMGIVVHITLNKTAHMEGRKQFIEKIGNQTVLTVSLNYTNTRQMFAKRALDILGGVIGCLVTGVLFLLLAPAIYIQSPGPIFFSQIRMGQNGRKFKLYKFRSMYLDAEERKKELMAQNNIKDGRMFKLDYDPRIIGCKKLPDGTIKKGIGNFIRDFSLDEFPQFYNILKGDMSLVGTRPPTVDEWEKYELHHRARLATRPGLTGMWQVSGRSNITDFEDVVKLDMRYIDEWSFGLDLKILLKTVLVVFGRDGAK